MSYRPALMIQPRARRPQGFGSVDTRMCRAAGGPVPCAPDPGVPSDWTFQPQPLADGTYNPAYVDSKGAAWGLLGGSGYIQTAKANGSQIVVSAVTGNSYGGPPAHPFAPGGGVIGEPTYPAPTPPVIGPGGVVVPSSAPGAYVSGTPASTTATTNVVSAPLPTTPASTTAGFSLSSIPWWVWAIGAGGLFFAFSGRK